jgi:hypothetical protein
LREFEKPSFLTHLHTIPYRASKPGKVSHIKFPEPVMAVKHKKLPLIIAIARNNKILSGKGSQEDAPKVATGFNPKQVLSWVEVVSYMSPSEKKELRGLLIDGIRDQRPKENKNLSSRKNQTWLSDFVDGEKEFETIGFAANAPYINVDKSYGDTKPI